MSLPRMRDTKRTHLPKEEEALARNAKRFQNLVALGSSSQRLLHGSKLSSYSPARNRRTTWDGTRYQNDQSMIDGRAEKSAHPHQNELDQPLHAEGALARLRDCVQKIVCILDGSFC